MFGRKVEVRLVRDNRKAITDNETPSIKIPEEAIARVTRNIVNRIAVGVIAVIGATVVLTSAGQILVNSIDNYQTQDKN